jgi:hypothetical protein
MINIKVQKKPAASSCWQRVLGNFCDLLLVANLFKLSHHNRQRAATMPMMVGMMVVVPIRVMKTLLAHCLKI